MSDLCYTEEHSFTTCIGQLKDMREALIQHGALDAAQETEELRLAVVSALVRWRATKGRLYGVWRAIERDCYDEAVDEALAAYRDERRCAHGDPVGYCSHWAACKGDTDASD
jgi:hypothetical protein